MLLAYEDSGTGPAVVLLHGFPLDRTMWAAQRVALERNYRVVTPDLRGHGASPGPDGEWSIEAMADDVLETLDAAALTQPVVLGGLSMGGYVALAAVRKAPERFRGLILLDTRAGSDSTDAAKGRRDAADGMLTGEDVRRFAEGMLPKLFSPVTCERRPERISPVRAVIEGTRPRTVAAALRAMAARPDRTGELSEIGVPTLIVVGADDLITPPEVAKAMAGAVKGSTLVVVPEAGHLAPWENPEVVNPAILGFLDALS